MISNSDAEVYEKYADELMRYASVLVGPSRAEDLVADTVLRVFSSPSWVGVLDHRPYLFRAVLYQARSDYRSSHRRSAREIRSRGRMDAPVEYVRVDVLDAMRRLNVRQRSVIFLHFWEDMPVEHIADLLEVSKRTVQRDLEVAHKRLEVLLQ
jgi:RNA polymerase sigma factor (sigma-70 family)